MSKVFEVTLRNPDGSDTLTRITLRYEGMERVLVEQDWKKRYPGWTEVYTIAGFSHDTRD